MHPIATNRQTLLQIVEGTISALQSRDPSTVVAAVAAATVSSPDEVEAQRGAVVNVLEKSARTLGLHNDLATVAPRVTADVGPAPPFIPKNQALSLIQSAIEGVQAREDTRCCGAVRYERSRLAADVPVVKIDERPRPDGEHMHGFEVLGRFDGDRLHISYIDELGTPWFQENLA